MIYDIIQVEKDILLLNIVTKFHKGVIKFNGLRDRTPSKLVHFHEQRAVIPEGIVRYKPLSPIRDAFCRDNPNSAYAISYFPPTNYQPAVMITVSHAF